MFQEGNIIKFTNYINRYNQAFQGIYRSINNMMKQHVHTDITTDQFTVLQFIFQHDKVTPSQMAQALGVGRSSITALVNRLVDRNMIKRERNKDDRRIVYLDLTDKGMHVVKETEEKIYRFLGDKLAHFPIEDIEGFLLSIEKLAILMDDDKGEQS